MVEGDFPRIVVPKADVRGEPVYMSRLLEDGTRRMVCRVRLELPISFNDYLLLADASDFGLDLIITPLGQRLFPGMQAILAQSEEEA